MSRRAHKTVCALAALALLTSLPLLCACAPAAAARPAEGHACCAPPLAVRSVDHGCCGGQSVTSPAVPVAPTAVAALPAGGPRLVLASSSASLPATAGRAFAASSPPPILRL